MIWPRPAATSEAGGGAAASTATVDTAAAATTASHSNDMHVAPPLWTQESASTAATDYNSGDDNHDHDGDHDDDDFALSQPPSPAWETSHLESPFIPSAQPVFYPLSLPASGIRPLTPPSPIQRSHANDTGVSDFDSALDFEDDIWDEILQGVSQVSL